MNSVHELHKETILNYPIPTGFEVYLNEKQISSIADYLAKRIDNDYSGTEPVIICALNGAALFVVDLITRLRIELILDFAKVESRGINVEGEGSDAKIKYQHDIEVTGKDVIIIDEMYDTGKSLKALTDYLKPFNPKSIRIVVAFKKIGADKFNILTENDYVGINVPPGWYIGYGLDRLGGMTRHRRCLFCKI